MFSKTRSLWFIWSSSVWISTALCTAGCILPYWLKGTIHTGIGEQLSFALGIHLTRLPSTLGLYRRCVYPIYVSKENGDINSNTKFYKQSGNHLTTTEHSGLIRFRAGCGYYRFEQIPHNMWRTALTFLSVACVILWFVSFFLLLVGCYVGLLNHPTLIRACQSLLLVSGSLVLSSCVLYPMGWNDNPEVKQICGYKSSSFYLGRCQLGWAYLLTLIGGFITVLSSALPSLCSHWIRNDSSKLFGCLIPPESKNVSSINFELPNRGPGLIKSPSACGSSQQFSINTQLDGRLPMHRQVIVYQNTSPYLPNPSANSQATYSSLVGSATEVDNKGYNQSEQSTMNDQK